jgi:hypothetical protein
LRRLGAQRDEISEWAHRRRLLDRRQQFATQLGSVETTLTSLLEELSARADELAPSSIGETHELCRKFDWQLMTVRRLWRWFADKFDQRDNERHARVLAAADEVVWSVYAGAMRTAHAGRVPSPAPLPYLDDLSAPEAVLRDDVPPAQLQLPDYDEALALLLRRLPMSVVGLPVGIVAEPWQLALLGHEVGHQLQYDLLPGWALIQSAGARVEAAAGGAGCGAQWRDWSRELFADLVGLVTLGTAALSALLPLEIGLEPYMLARDRGRYPPPVVRLAVMRAMAEQLGLEPGPPTAAERAAAELARTSGDFPRSNDGWLWPEGSPALALTAAAADLDRVPVVAAALVTGPVVGSRTLAQLAGFCAQDFAAGGRVMNQARDLRHGRGVIARGLPAVRTLVSGGIVAWQQVTAGPDSDTRLPDLAGALVDRIISGAEDGTRAAAPSAAGSTSADVALGAELARILTRGFTP